MFLVHITNPKSFVFNFWGSLQKVQIFLFMPKKVHINLHMSKKLNIWCNVEDTDTA